MLSKFRTPPIPIFIISFNRLEALQKSIASYRRMRPTPCIVIHDTGSTYQPLLDYLRDLQESKAALVFLNRPSIRVQNDLTEGIAATVEQYFRNRRPSHYVVTDPDIEFEENTPSDALRLYKHLLDKNPGVDVVGPMLRIDDIPKHYPLRLTVMERHSNAHFGRPMESMKWNKLSIRFVRTYIDTTFGMYRAGFRFKKMSPAIRVMEPYWARHLDWYIDPAKMADDQKYYLDTASRVSHWGGKWLRKEMKEKGVAPAEGDQPA